MTTSAATTGLFHETVRHDGREVLVMGADLQKGDFVWCGGLWQVAATPVRSLSGASVVLKLCSLSDFRVWDYRTVCVGICDRVIKIELSEVNDD